MWLHITQLHLKYEPKHLIIKPKLIYIKYKKCNKNKVSPVSGGY